jgi:putative transposase
MPLVVYAFLSMLGVLFRSQLSVRAENIALRHQLAVYRRTVKRPIIRPEDRILWSWLSRCWARWREVLVFVQPATVIAWQRKRFRDHWTRLSRAGKPGRPLISEEIRELIRRVSGANPLWGTPRIVGELGNQGGEVDGAACDRVRHPRRRGRRF